MGTARIALFVIVVVAAVAGLVAFLTGGGGRPQSVAVGPIDVGATPREVMFFGPVPAPGPVCEVCMEFERPRDSHAAKDVRVVLVTPEGRQDTLRDPEVDRRGERLVCLIDRGRLAAVRAAGAPANSYRSAWLSSGTPTRVRELRFRSGK